MGWLHPVLDEKNVQWMMGELLAECGTGRAATT
jgi:hypothetical protein